MRTKSNILIYPLDDENVRIDVEEKSLYVNIDEADALTSALCAFFSERELEAFADEVAHADLPSTSTSY